ncbi:ribosome maturation factor RimM [Candidatus Erwinia haradaeae]|uniref:Ribosome maturation factor RimM n=1 Tax=Candidatus Erwinia haradaeae TaxID=1922217 RepID=A0A451D1H9_9GAMM|nr:ribosome maturation factor RimM [Candidatus Erwinia haradaeae]VFP79460.1 Ribosome maturation factor RimM [Candidatus Erwinia haradaeae]
MKVPLTKRFPINPLVIGSMGSSYGTHGWLKIFSSTEDKTNIFNYQPWFVQIFKKWDIIVLENWKYHNNQLIIKIQDIDCPEIVRKQLTNQKIIINASQLPTLEKGEYYWKDLIGCQVINIHHLTLGVVIKIIETGANDVLIVHTNIKVHNKIKNRLIPFVHNKVIKTIDLPERIIYVDWD